MSQFSGFGKMLIIMGLGMAFFGAILWLGGKLPGIGRLPGDILIKRENFTFYFPLTTSILVSIVLSVLIALFRRN